MWSNRNSDIGWLVAVMVFSGAAHADLSCPPTHAGKPLTIVDVYHGPINENAVAVPRPGGWDLYDTAITNPALMTYDHRLRCRYQNTNEEVVVLLPHGTRVCEFDRSYPKVSCHP